MSDAEGTEIHADGTAFHAEGTEIRADSTAFPDESTRPHPR